MKLLKNLKPLEVDFDLEFGKQLKWTAPLVPFNATFTRTKRTCSEDQCIVEINYPMGV